MILCVMSVVCYMKTNNYKKSARMAFTIVSFFLAVSFGMHSVYQVFHTQACLNSSYHSSCACCTADARHRSIYTGNYYDHFFSDSHGICNCENTPGISCGSGERKKLLFISAIPDKAEKISVLYSDVSTKTSLVQSESAIQYFLKPVSSPYYRRSVVILI